MVIFFVVLAVLFVLFCWNWYLNRLKEMHLRKYVHLGRLMQAAGYEGPPDKKGELRFTKADPGICIRFDLENAVAYKNEYEFPIPNKPLELLKQPYLRINFLTQLLNREIRIEKKGYALEKPAARQWPADYPPLIAHAGGGIIDKQGRYDFTNAYDALVQNYNKGHRVFELDFSLTTDGHYVALHDWEGNYGEWGDAPLSEPLSREDFLAYKILGRYTTMDLDEVLRQMRINEDLCVIFDTKVHASDDPAGALRLMAEAVYARCRELDETLLERVIIQMYSREMYAPVQAVYPFRMLYTTCLPVYGESHEEIAAFMVEDAENIRACSVAPKRTSSEFVRQLAEADKPVFLYAINQIDDMTILQQAFGVCGFFTDFVSPGEYKTRLNKMTDSRKKELGKIGAVLGSLVDTRSRNLYFALTHSYREKSLEPLLAHLLVLSKHSEADSSLTLLRDNRPPNAQKDHLIVYGGNFYAKVLHQTLEQLGVQAEWIATTKDMMEASREAKVFMCTLNDTLHRQRLTKNGFSSKNLYSHFDIVKSSYLDKIAEPMQHEVLVAAGAWAMDYAKWFIGWSTEGYDSVYALMPGATDYKNGQTRLEALPEAEQAKISLSKQGLWRTAGKVKYAPPKYPVLRNEKEPTVTIDCATIDTLLGAGPATLICLDINGMELQALKGAEQTIRNHRPRLAVCISNARGHLWEIPAYLRQLVPDYKMYVRHGSLTFERTILYCI